MCRKKLENMSRNEQENNVIKQTDNIYARKYKKFKHKWVVRSDRLVAPCVPMMTAIQHS